MPGDRKPATHVFAGSSLAADPLAYCMPPQLALLRRIGYLIKALSEPERKAVLTWLQMRGIALGSFPQERTPRGRAQRNL